MRKIIAFLLMGLVNFTVFAGQPLYIDSLMVIENLTVNQDLYIYDASILVIDELNVTSSISIENYGHIVGDIFLCDSCNLQLRNSGNIMGGIYLYGDASLTQVIENPGDVKQLDVHGTGFSILIQSTDTVSLSDVIKISSAAERIILKDANIFLTIAPLRATFGAPQKEIEFHGEVLLLINHADIQNTTAPILSNVSGDGIINVKMLGLDPLYVASAAVRDGNVYLDIKREMDYAKILGTGAGKFANKLRTISPDSPTLIAMENADTLSKLSDIIGRSATFNPINLMRPIKLFNTTTINPGQQLHTFNLSGFEASYFLSSSFDLYAAKISAAANFDDVTVSLSAYAGQFENADSLNEFSGTFYGANARARINNKSLWIDATAGFTIAEFETDAIFDGRDAIYNPDGISFYGATDVGTRFGLGGGFHMSPFAGVGGEYDKILHQSDTDIFVRAGSAAGISSETSGIKNDYQIFGVIQTNNIYSLGLLFGFWSIADTVGGNISYAVVYDGNEYTHKVSAGMNLEF